MSPEYNCGSLTARRTCFPLVQEVTFDGNKNKVTNKSTTGVVH